MSTNTVLSQKVRLCVLLIYIVGLLGASKIALNTWLPPTTEKGLWFYSALAGLLLGNLLITPFFTKPADAIAYAVASVIALLSVNPWFSSRLTSFDRFAWLLSVVYVIIVLISAIMSIVLRGVEHPLGQRISKSLFLLSDTLGNPRAIFSIIFLFAIITYHRNVPQEYLTIGIAWGIFVGFRPLEELLHLFRRIRGIWRTSEDILRLGDVVGHEVPNIVLVREEEGHQAKFGDVIVVRDDEGQSSYALALDHVGYAEGRWLRAIHFSKAPSNLNTTTSDGSAYLLSPRAIQDNDENHIFSVKDRLLGLVATDTSVGRLKIEIVRNDLALHQGCLVEAKVGLQRVLYQVIDGITREEIIHQKNKRGFIRAEAKKIGIWNKEKNKFDTVPWLPQPNGTVLFVGQCEQPMNRDAIGHFPGTAYPVMVNCHALVTHNTAILGILGVGKSFLALELIERMIGGGIKAICLDMTNQYATELAPFYTATTENAEISELEQIGPKGKTNFHQNVEEGGSINEFSAKVQDQIKKFLDPADQRKLKIINPAKFEVWRQDSKIYNNKASMVTLTPTEITRIITEATLNVLQFQGMTDQARCCLVYEEAHSLIPEWNAVASEGDKTATNGTAKAILQGRKFGLGCLVITQRTANVTKTILNQCNTVFALRVFDATGTDFLRNYIGEDYAAVLSNLENRHAIIFGRASSCDDPVLIRLNDRQKFIEAFHEQPQSTATT